MQQDDDDDFPLQSTSAGLSQAPFASGKSRTSLVRVQNQRLRVMDERSDYNKFRRQSGYCEHKERLYSRSREDAREERGFLKKGGHSSEERVFSSPDFVVSDCWKTTSGEVPVKLIQLFKESKPEALEEEDEDVPVKKRRLVLEEESEKLCHTKEFHVLTEVQKARILTAVEDAIKKLANKDMKDYSQGLQEPSQEDLPFVPAERSSLDKFFYKKFLLPWIIVKVIEMVLCHVIQLTFLSEESYFNRKTEFLPVVVTYYLTLFIVVFSLVIHISFSYAGIRNPCYFMGVISTSILTLTTTLGILVMLSSMQYYTSFREILVLVFIGVLLFSLFVELCLCYFEVKSIWKRIGQAEQYYVA